jgi:superfamily I DNA/RNA helicase
MAHILPEALPQVLPAEVHRVFRALKGLPNAYYVWHHLAPWQPDTPDFLVLSGNGQALLVKVSGAPAGQASPTAQLLLIEDERPPLGLAEGRVLEQFLQSIAWPARQPIGRLVAFPNIPHRQVMAGRPISPEAVPEWAGRELLHDEGTPGWVDFLPPAAPDPAWVERLRQAFTPEVVVPAGLTVRTPQPHRLEAGLTDYLLDYDQESAVKTDLDLDPVGQALSSDFRLNIVNGVAGSGKTLILLYRLRLLHGLYPEKRFLALTHNRPLIHDIQARFARLAGRLPENIAWHTFNSWCYHHWPAETPWVEPLGLRARQRVVRAVWESCLAKSAISERMILSEIDWLKDQLPMDEAAYLQADRRGRGFGLNAEQRQRVYAAFLSYQTALEEQGAVDWGDVPRRVWSALQARQPGFPQYDVILVDETQFFAPLWIAILHRLLKPHNAHLFLVADPTQGFLGRGASWKSLGLAARGRSQQLRRSYRTTREILRFATLFYRLRLAGESDEDILAPDLFDMPNGVLPQVISLASAQDETARVANEVEAFVRQGLPRQHLLVLHANGRGVAALKEAINHRLGKSAAIDPKDTYPGDYVRVTTLNAGAGLESPIVFLAGLRELFEEEQSLRLSDEEREALIRDNTRRIYMAATRAGQRLVFTYVGDLPQALQESLRDAGGEAGAD